MEDRSSRDEKLKMILDEVEKAKREGSIERDIYQPDRIHREDRVIERGIAHVRVIKKPNKVKKKKCDDDDNDGINVPKKEPVVDYHCRTLEEDNQAPYVIVVHGPPKVGKSLLIKSLMKHYTDHDETVVAGATTLVLGNRRRIQFVECPNNVSGMIDAAKYADAVIFMIDAAYGFEMETFELLNIVQVHSILKIIGVLTYLDGIKDTRKPRKTKNLMDQFCAEIHESAELFCLSGLDQGMYRTEEIRLLANFIMNMEFHSSSWRAQPYVLTHYFEDDTPPEKVNMDEKCYRNITLYGYLRGRECCDIKEGNKVYIAGVGDFPLFGVSVSTDPFPLPTGNMSFQYRERSEIKGFREGTFLRLEVQNVPSEMVKNLDPHLPVLVGFIGSDEEDLGYNQVTLNLHDWHRKLLKTRDPIIVSIGWRRYETFPIYAMEGCHGRLERIDYTPNDKQCIAMFWGPLAPPDTRIILVQSFSDDEAAFRILASAVVNNCNHAAKVSENRVLIGTPCKISKKTALIQNMFTSDLQIDRYKDKRIQTKSGIRGKIIKAEKKMKDGSNRVIAKCRFKSKVLMSDTVFMSVWKKVEVPRSFNPLMAASKASNCVWQRSRPRDDMAPSHVVQCDKVDCCSFIPDSEGEEEKLKRRELCKKLKERIQEERQKKIDAGKRQMYELPRPVIIVTGVLRDQTSCKLIRTF